MTFKLFRLLLRTVIFSLSAAFANAQDARFPAILIKDAEVNQIECEITRVLDDGTVSFKPTREGGLEQGVVYAVLVNKRPKSPHPGNGRKSKRQFGQARARTPQLESNAQGPKSCSKPSRVEERTNAFPSAWTS